MTEPTVSAADWREPRPWTVAIGYATVILCGSVIAALAITGLRGGHPASYPPSKVTPTTVTVTQPVAAQPPIAAPSNTPTPLACATADHTMWDYCHPHG